MKQPTVCCGADRIMEYKDLFQGRRIGLITNPSGVRCDFISTADYLSRHFNLAAMYAPEHGVRGNAQDGQSIGSYTDETTGVTVHSIYGENRRPSAESMEGIDLMVYDIQDIGSRFYTYIYSMANCMEESAKKGIPFVVLDRPNPIGGLSPEGSGLEDECRSFIGMYPIPQRYSLTCGEIANLFNKEYGMGAQLHIVPMGGWKRKMLWNDTGLPWINPSPNIVSPEGALLYNGTALFEGTNLSEGRGTTRPFEYIGAPWINPWRLADTMNAKRLPGVRFRPLYFTPMFHKHKDTLCGGVQIHVTEPEKVRPWAMGLHLLLAAKEQNETEFRFTAPRHEIGDFTVDLMYGSAKLREGALLEELLSESKQTAQAFSLIWRQYQLYE